MPLNAKVVQFPNAFGSDYSLTGVGFQPKAGIFFGNAAVAGVTGQADMRPWIGLVGSAGTSDQVGGAYNSTSAQPTSDCNAYQGAATIGAGALMLADGTVTHNNDLETFDADGLTAHLYGASDFASHGLLLGGGDLKNAKTFSVALPTSSGSLSVTGIGFQGDLVILFHSNIHASSTTYRSFCLGWATSPTNQGMTGVTIRDAQATMVGHRYQSNDECMALFTNGGVVATVDLASFDADGLTFTVDNPLGQDFTIYGMVIKGVTAQCGTFNATGGSPDKAITGVGFRPRAVLVMSNGNPSGSGVSTNAYLNVGAASSADTAEQFAITEGDRTAIADSDSQESTRSATFLLERQYIKGWDDRVVATLTSLDADGFSVNFSVATRTSDDHLYLAIGDKPTVQINGGSILGAKIAAA